MKALKIIGIILVALAAIGFIAVTLLPSEAHLERSIVIDAKREIVHNYINNIRKFNEWSPWHDIDPNTEYTYEGPESGIGAKMIWSSEHRDVGKGSQWIVETSSGEYVKTKLEFEGFDEPSEANLLFVSEEGGTKVTWTLDSNLNGFDKLFGLMMDGVVGPMYEKGLNSLKNNIESMPDFAIEISQEEIEPIYYLGIKVEVPSNDHEAIAQAMGGAYGELMGYVQGGGQQMAGMPICVYHNIEGETIVMEPAIPLNELAEVDHDKIDAGEIPTSKVVKGIHLGDYSELETTHIEMKRYLEANNLSINGNIWEQYITDPSIEPDTSKWVTHVFYPVN